MGKGWSGVFFCFFSFLLSSLTSYYGMPFVSGTSEEEHEGKRESEREETERET